MPRAKGDAMKWDGIKLTKVRLPKSPSRGKRVYEVTMLIEDTEFKGCCDDCRWFSPRFIAEAIKDQFALDKCRIKNLKIRRVKA